MPLEASSGQLKALIPALNLKIYDNAAHGLYHTAANEVLSDILAQLN